MNLLPANFHFSVAPMMDYTDRHARYFLRLLSPNVRLYTEMITSQAIINGDRDYLLKFHPAEKYVALQLGGSDPKQLAFCARLGQDYGYDEINLNVGCPSSRVKEGQFGACLMLNPKLVAECIAAMKAVVNIPVTIKCRIGVDDSDSYAELCHFVKTISSAGCKTFIVHARKAWLTGLSPKENRDIPPLRYDIVERLKNDFPQLEWILNGGITSITDIQNNLHICNGMMIGRAAMNNPYLLAEIDVFFYQRLAKSRAEIIAEFLPYVEHELTRGIKFSVLSKLVLGLFRGQKGGKAWRRYISEEGRKVNIGSHLLRDALILT